MKRIVALLTVLCMLLSIVPAMAETVTGTGSAKGFGGDVTVTITVTDGVITDVKAEGADETPGVGTPALEQLPAAMKAGNTVNVDIVSGATFTSNAVLEAAKAALANAGLNADDYMTKAEAAAAVDTTYDVDVVIVGAGGAGMTAALTAAEYGAKVIIVESQAAVGGNSVRATGGMNAGDTPTQDTNTFGETAGVEAVLKNAAAYADNEAIAELAAEVTVQWQAYQQNPTGYFDTEELMELDTMIGGKGINDPELVETLAEDSSEGIEWLKKYGIDLCNVGAFGGASVKRIHRPVNAEGKTVSVGAYMIPLMKDACDANENITILLETTANEIIMADGKAAGIIATGKGGETVTVNAKAVILAAGGFGANLEMVASYKAELEGFMTTNAPGIQGQGILMAQKVGAATVDMEQIQIHPTVQFDTAALITEGLRGDGAILVNAEGKRFIDEVGTRDVVSAAEINQTGSYSWLIVDQAMLDKSSVIAGYVKKGFVFSGATYEELAAAIGVPAEDFAATMNAWNGYVAAKNDPEFGRVSFANPLDTAPYYAIKVTAGVHHTMGGVKINDDTEVLTAEGVAIPGLYAAGEITGGVHGANRLGGNAVSDFVVFGRIAGEEAAEEALGLDD
ncbi:MAG: flavocytochrome c [Clostridiales bacterium]|nr:flavocytochrome c [Clostridiales bacterium]